MAVKFGAKIVDGFDVDTIRQEGDIVRVTSKTGVSHSSPSLGKYEGHPVIKID